jgi:hypothetical protein
LIPEENNSSLSNQDSKITDFGIVIQDLAELEFRKFPSDN